MVWPIPLGNPCRGSSCIHHSGRRLSMDPSSSCSVYTCTPPFMDMGFHLSVPGYVRGSKPYHHFHEVRDTWDSECCTRTRCTLRSFLSISRRTSNWRRWYPFNCSYVGSKQCAFWIDRAHSCICSIHLQAQLLNLRVFLITTSPSWFAELKNIKK